MKKNCKSWIIGLGAAGSGIAVGTGRGGDEVSLDGWLEAMFSVALARLLSNRPSGVRSSTTPPGEWVRSERWFRTLAEVAL